MLSFPSDVSPNELYIAGKDPNSLTLSNTPNSSFSDASQSFHPSYLTSSTYFSKTLTKDFFSNNFSSNTEGISGPSSNLHYNSGGDSFGSDGNFDRNCSLLDFPGLLSEQPNPGSSDLSAVSHSGIQVVEPHRPLFGVHPQIIPYSDSSIDSQIFYHHPPSPAQTTTNVAAPPETSTPLRSIHVPQTGASVASGSNIRTPKFASDPNTLNWITVNDLLQVQCPDCFKFIKTNSHSSFNTAPLDSHRAGKRCKPCDDAGLAQQSELNAAKDMRQLLFASSSEKENHRSSSVRGPTNTAMLYGPAIPESRNNEPATDLNVNFNTTLSHDRELETDSSPRDHSSSFMRDRSLQLDAQELFDLFPLPSTGDCPGISLDWPLDYLYQSYPFSRHDRTGASHGFRLSYVSTNGLHFRIRAEVCIDEDRKSTDGTTCYDCRKLRKVINHIAQKAEHAEPCTNYGFLSSRQMQEVTRDKDKTIQDLKLRILALSRKYATLLTHHDDAKRFIVAVAENDIPRLHQLVKQCLKDGASTKQIVAKLEDSIAKVYHARGYDQADLDIALLSYRLGNQALLFALNQHSSIPSLRTLQRRQAFTRLLPSHGAPTADELSYNLKQVLECHISNLDTTKPFRSGMSIFWDEINEEDAACYFPHSDSVGGLCREHGHLVDTRLHTLQSAYSIANALADNTVHYGKEASVIAVGSFGSVIQGALPIAISPTCKKETPEESGNIAQLVIATYNMHYAKYFGPIWSVSSDGDAGRRLMAHLLFMCQTVTSEHVLYKYLGRLPGLNLQVGEYDITADIDWKHLVKRIARLLRTLEGTIIGHTIVNREVLLRHLSRIEGLTDSRIHLLMNPADAQDVPRAMELLATLEQVQYLPSEQCSPTELQEVEILSVITNMFSAFLNAFTNVTWSLNEQLIALSKFAHMSFILFKKNRVNFMPNQLYIDSQTCVKNAFFCVAKQQEMDRTQDFHLFLLGDDRLENLFGRIRMQGGHNPNCTFKQLVDRAGAAVDINNVFLRNPHLDRGHRRLKVNRIEHYDHLNKELWQGSQSVQHVVLEDTWSCGRDAAQTALEKSGCSENLAKAFTSKKTDMMRPFGDDHYPGISDQSEVDRSNPEDDTVHTASEAPAALSVDEIYSNLYTEEDDTQDQDLQENVFAFDEGEMEHFEVIPVGLATTSTDGSAPEFDDQLELEDIIEEPPELALPRSSNITDTEISPWLPQEPPGKRVHKATVCRLIINPDWARKSHERILRVRGYSTERKYLDLNSDNVIDKEAFIVGDLYASLIRSDGILSLAIMKCVALEEKSTRTERIDRRTMVFPASKIQVYGQILDMRETHITMQDSSQTDLEDTMLVPSEDESTWIWTGSYAKLDISANTRTAPLKGKAARKTLVVKTSSQHCQVVSPRVIQTDLLQNDEQHDVGGKITWALNENELLVLVEQLWQTIKTEKSINTVPKFAPNSYFPYKNEKACVVLMSIEGSAALATVNPSDAGKFRCYQCHHFIPPTQARDHVGRHILRSMRGVEENLTGEPITGDFPCGICGQSNLPQCSQLFLSKGSSPQARSGCPHFVKFRYHSALTSTTSTPCTNVPILCTIPHCTKTTNEGLSAVWKYNMEAHIQAEHPGYSMDMQQGIPFPNDLIASIFITKEEELRIKIPLNKIPHKIVPIVEPSPPAQTRTRGTKRKSTNTGTSASKKRK